MFKTFKNGISSFCHNTRGGMLVSTSGRLEVYNAGLKMTDQFPAELSLIAASPQSNKFYATYESDRENQELCELDGGLMKSRTLLQQLEHVTKIAASDGYLALLSKTNNAVHTFDLETKEMCEVERIDSGQVQDINFMSRDSLLILTKKKLLNYEVAKRKFVWTSSEFRYHGLRVGLSSPYILVVCHRPEEELKRNSSLVSWQTLVLTATAGTAAVEVCLSHNCRCQRSSPSSHTTPTHKKNKPHKRKSPHPPPPHLIHLLLIPCSSSSSYAPPTHLVLFPSNAPPLI